MGSHVKPSVEQQVFLGCSPAPGIFRVAPFSGETTSSLICRVASCYGLEAKVLRSCWHWRNSQPGHGGGGARADAEVLLNAAGRQRLAGLCGVKEDVLARALPSWGQEDAKLSAGEDIMPAEDQKCRPQDCSTRQGDHSMTATPATDTAPWQ